MEFCVRTNIIIGLAWFVHTELALSGWPPARPNELPWLNFTSDPCLHSSALWGVPLLQMKACFDQIQYSASEAGRTIQFVRAAAELLPSADFGKEIPAVWARRSDILRNIDEIGDDVKSGRYKSRQHIYDMLKSSLNRARDQNTLLVSPPCASAYLTLPFLIKAQPARSTDRIGVTYTLNHLQSGTDALSLSDFFADGTIAPWMGAVLNSVDGQPVDEYLYSLGFKDDQQYYSIDGTNALLVTLSGSASLLGGQVNSHNVSAGLVLGLSAPGSQWTGTETKLQRGVSPDTQLYMPRIALMPPVTDVDDFRRSCLLSYDSPRMPREFPAVTTPFGLSLGQARFRRLAQSKASEHGSTSASSSPQVAPAAPSVLRELRGLTRTIHAARATSSAPQQEARNSGVPQGAHSRQRQLQSGNTVGLSQRYGWPLRLQRETASEYGDGTVSMVFNSVGSEGLRLLGYRPVDGKRDAWMILQSLTMLPDSIQQCFSGRELSSSFSPSVASLQTTQCVRDAVSQFVYRASIQVRTEMKLMGAKRLMVDLRSNVGGSIALSVLWMARLFGVEDPGSLLLPIRFRRSPALVSLTRFVQDKLRTDPGWSERVDVQTMLAELYLVHAGERVTLTEPIRRLQQPEVVSRSDSSAATNATGPWSSLDLSWYSDPNESQLQLPNGGYANLSDPVLALPSDQLLDVLDPQVWAFEPDMPMNASNVVFLTNGMCGSACAQMLRSVQRHGLAKVIHASASDSLHGQLTSFTGGVSIPSMQELSVFAQWAEQEGWNASEVPGGRGLTTPPEEPIDMAASAGLAFCPPQLDLPCDLSMSQADITVTAHVLSIIGTERTLDDEWDLFVCAFQDLSIEENESGPCRLDMLDDGRQALNLEEGSDEGDAEGGSDVGVWVLVSASSLLVLAAALQFLSLPAAV